MWLTPSSSMGPAWSSAGQWRAAAFGLPQPVTRHDEHRRADADRRRDRPVGPAAFCVDVVSPTSTTLTCPWSATTSVSDPSDVERGGEPVGVPDRDRREACDAAPPAVAEAPQRQRCRPPFPPPRMSWPRTGSPSRCPPCRVGQHGLVPPRRVRPGLPHHRGLAAARTGRDLPARHHRRPARTRSPRSRTPRSARVLCSGVPVEDRRTQASPCGVHTATSRPASSLCHDPTTAAPPGTSTASIRSPAPQPPKVLNACACSATPVARAGPDAPAHVAVRAAPVAADREDPGAVGGQRVPGRGAAVAGGGLRRDLGDRAVRSAPDQPRRLRRPPPGGPRPAAGRRRRRAPPARRRRAGSPV